MTELAHGIRKVQLFAVGLLVVAFSTSRGSAEPQQGVEEHPLVPVLKIAEQGLKRIDADVQDYSATLIKKERVRGRLTDNQYLFVKVRHQPFSVYISFLAPEDFKGREVIYVAGQNGNKLLAHEGRGWKARIGKKSCTFWKLESGILT